MTELEKLHRETLQKMDKTGELLVAEFSRLRTARANPAILDTVKVDYYGTPTPLKQLAAISVPEARLLVIQPWDKSSLGEIEKAIHRAELGLTPQSDGNVIRLPIPPLSEERRRDLVKLCHKLTEDARVAVRNLRRDANEAIKKLEKDKKVSEDEARNAQKKVQEYTDDHIKKLDAHFAKKEKEILET